MCMAPGVQYTRRGVLHLETQAADSHSLEGGHCRSHLGTDIDLLGRRGPQVQIQNANKRRELLVELIYLLRPRLA